MNCFLRYLVNYIHVLHVWLLFLIYIVYAMLFNFRVFLEFIYE